MDRFDSSSTFRTNWAEGLDSAIEELDSERRIEAMDLCADRGYFGVNSGVATGLNLSQKQLGALCAAIGKNDLSLVSLLTAHGLVVAAIRKWGSAQQKNDLLPLLSTGRLRAAFCLSEPTVGSDAQAVRATLQGGPSEYRLDGEKSWVTGGQIANLFLVIARLESQPTAILVEGTTEGLSVEPVAPGFGLRGGMLAHLSFAGCPVESSKILGPLGGGINCVAMTALDEGRFRVSWSCLGAHEACLEEAIAYASQRHQSGKRIIDHQLVQRMIAEMEVSFRASHQVCLWAAEQRERRSVESTGAVLIAKYHSAKHLRYATQLSLRILGAHGLMRKSRLERHFRDAQVMGTIEGTDEILQLAISDFAVRSYLDRTSERQ